MTFLFRSAAISVTLAAAALAPSAVAQQYPNKPIRLLIPSPPGGGTDILGRILKDGLTDLWAQPVVVDNRGGASGRIAAAAVSRATPDGYTLFFTYGGVLTTGLPLFRKLPYDPIRDFAPITELASLPMMLLVHPSVPAKNLKEFIALAKSNSAGLDYASSGPGTSTHLAAEMFNTMAGTRLVHVPFKGNAEVYNALLGGHIKVHFSLVPSGIAHVRAGKLRVLAVTTEKRLPYLPDVPTVAEAGYSGYEITSWQGVFAPAGTPRDVIGKINGELSELLKTPAMQKRMATEGADPVGSTPEDFAKRVAGEIIKWANVARESGLAIAK
jgi:tripartite-type tricarboxylate transporter receptor subunit TctC